MSLEIWPLWVAFSFICLHSFLSLYKCPTHTKYWHREFDFLRIHCMKKCFIFFGLSLFHFIPWQKMSTCFLPFWVLPVTQAQTTELCHNLFLSLCGLPHCSSEQHEPSFLRKTPVPPVWHRSKVRQILFCHRRGWYILKAWHGTVPCRDTTQIPKAIQPG